MIFNGFKIKKNFQNIKFLLVLIEKARRVFFWKRNNQRIRKTETAKIK